MRLKRILPVLAVTTMVTAGLAACGGKKGPALPTLAPTPTPKAYEGSGPKPTEAPDRNYTKIIELNGEDFNQTAQLSANSGKITVQKTPHTGEYAFCLMDREDASMGVSVNLARLNDGKYDVIGKKAHIAVWVYQETGKKADFTCTLTVKKEDNTSSTPASLTYSDVPSGVWYLIESDLEVPAGVKNPTVSFGMNSSTDAFYFDDLRFSFDPKSKVDALNEETKRNVEIMFFNFEDNDAHFVSRGSGTGTVKNDGVDGSKCLLVSNRTSNWNGVQIDLTEYNFAGKKVYITFNAKQMGSGKAKVIGTFELKERNSESIQYPNVASTDSISPNTWAKASGSYDVPANAESVILYFETGSTENFSIDNVLITTLDPKTIDMSALKPDPKGIVASENEAVMDTSRFTRIHYLTADSGKSEVDIMNSRGCSKPPQVTNHGKFENGFLISGRTATWNGMGIDFTSIDGKKFDVIGKEIFVSFWVYQNSGETVEFNATLQVNKPDGSTAWPERISITSLESGKWTYVEGTIPIYANVTVPMLNFEIPSHETCDFMLDNITVMVDLNSSIPENESYVVKEKKQFTKLSLDFEDNNAYFEGRGNARATIAYGGHASNKCMGVVGRTASWHGVQADLSDYDLAGKTVNVSYWVYHEYATPISIAFTAQQNDGTNETYTSVVPATEVKDGKWIQFTNTFTFDSNAKKYYLYFESPSETAEFFVDDVVIELVP